MLSLRHAPRPSRHPPYSDPPSLPTAPQPQLRAQQHVHPRAPRPSHGCFTSRPPCCCCCRGYCCCCARPARSAAAARSAALGREERVDSSGVGRLASTAARCHCALPLRAQMVIGAAYGELEEREAASPPGLALAPSARDVVIFLPDALALWAVPRREGEKTQRGGWSSLSLV